jgi:hypothetical protein
MLLKKIAAPDAALPARTVPVELLAGATSGPPLSNAG